jgi:trimethylamine---corrinoid protein Co-methyltransferase
MESAYCGSLTQLLLCNDIINWVKHFLAPVEITDETLALDVIDAVGPDGLFLKHKHTRHHARERFEGRVFDRLSYQQWAADGAKDTTTRAAERVDEILAGGVAEPLGDDVQRALHAIVEEAERQVGRRPPSLAGA